MSQLKKFYLWFGFAWFALGIISLLLFQITPSKLAVNYYSGTAFWVFLGTCIPYLALLVGLFYICKGWMMKDFVDEDKAKENCCCASGVETTPTETESNHTNDDETEKTESTTV